MEDKLSNRIYRRILKNEILSTLDEDQRKIVLAATNRNRLIIAGAGSGKTRTLVMKIVYMIKVERISPDNILAITFTKVAKQEMLDRLITELGISIAKQIEIRTIHSLAQMILFKNKSYLPKEYQNFSIASDSIQRALVEECAEEIYEENKSNEFLLPIYNDFKRNKNIVCASILNNISNYKSNLLPENYFTNSIKNGELILDLKDYFSAQHIYNRYCKKLRDIGCIDFNDMIKLAISLLNNYEILRTKYRSIFKYILIDECQDTSELQYCLLDLIGVNNGSITYMFGDDYQSIYGFAGANVMHIVDHIKTLPSFELLKLTKNYRSTQNIVNGSNSVIRYNSYQIPKTCISQNELGEYIYIKENTDELDEIDFIINEIKEKNLKDVCLLTNSIKRLSNYEKQLVAKKVKYEIIGAKPFIEKREIATILNRMYIAIDHTLNANFIESLLSFRGLGPKTLLKLKQLSNITKSSLYEVSKDVIKEKNKESLYYLRNPEKDRLRIFIDTIDKSREYIYDIDNIVKNFCDIYDFTKEIAEYDDYSSRLNRGDAPEINLNNLQDIISEYKRDLDTNSLAEILANIYVDYTEHQDIKDKDSIKIMTYWKSKGLEFENVFLIQTSNNSSCKRDTNEEARRAFYVAMTRAKKRLYICYPRFSIDPSKSNMKYVKNKDNFIFKTKAPHKCIKEIDVPYKLKI